MVLEKKKGFRGSEAERKGKTTPYTSMNGHMFSFLTKEGSIGLRLSSEDRSTFMEKYDCRLMIQHNTVMKEFVEVPSKMLSNTELISGFLQKSMDYTASLKPKPTRKK